MTAHRATGNAGVNATDDWLETRLRSRAHFGCHPAQAPMIAIALLAALASMPQNQDLEPPAAALTGPSSTRLALPVTLRFEDTLTDDVSSLINKESGRGEGASRE